MERKYVSVVACISTPKEKEGKVVEFETKEPIIKGIGEITVKKERTQVVEEPKVQDKADEMII